MFNHTISAILRGSWLIEKGFADSHMPIVLGLLKGNLSGTELLKGNGEFEGPFFINSNGNTKPAYVFMDGKGIVVNQPEPNSVAVIPFIGPMVKYNGECGEPGMIKRQSWIRDLSAEPNVVGLISLMDTPGGQADGTPQTASYIKSITKPTAAVILSGAFSAGAWIYAAHDVAYAADKYSEVGSIGAYTTVVDYSGYFEKMGIKLTEVYPEISKDKNLSYRKAIEGDTSLIKKEIHNLAFAFREEFEAYRDGKLTSDEWNTGKIFSAEDAVKLGMIDGIMSLQEVANKMITGSLFSQAKKVFASATKKISSQVNNQQINMELGNVEALANVENVTEAQIDLANADLTAAGITNVTLVPESLITEAATATAERDSLTADLETANTARTTAEESLSTANARITQLESELATALAVTPGDTHQSSKGNDDPADVKDEDDIEALLAAMPHNKNADSIFN